MLNQVAYTPWLESEDYETDVVHVPVRWGHGPFHGTSLSVTQHIMSDISGEVREYDIHEVGLKTIKPLPPRFVNIPPIVLPISDHL